MGTPAAATSITPDVASRYLLRRWVLMLQHLHPRMRWWMLELLLLRGRERQLPLPQRLQLRLVWWVLQVCCGGRCRGRDGWGRCGVSGGVDGRSSPPLQFKWGPPLCYLSLSILRLHRHATLCVEVHVCLELLST